MSTKPRNPRFFPAMKVRGARRRRLAPWQRTARAFDRMGVAMRTAGHVMAMAMQATQRLQAAVGADFKPFASTGAVELLNEPQMTENGSIGALMYDKGEQ